MSEASESTPVAESKSHGGVRGVVPERALGHAPVKLFFGLWFLFGAHYGWSTEGVDGLVLLLGAGAVGLILSGMAEGILGCTVDCPLCPSGDVHFPYGRFFIGMCQETHRDEAQGLFRLVPRNAEKRLDLVPIGTARLPAD